MKIKNTPEYYLLHFLPVIIVYFFSCCNPNAILQ